MNPIGSYTLASVNGRDVPALWEEIAAGNGDRIRTLWVAGRAVFRPDGLYCLTIEGSVAVGERTQALPAFAAEGTWRTTGDGHVELHSLRGPTSRWQASSDSTVLVARSRRRSRSTFVFLRDAAGR
jgi:hypothetical protein